MYESTKTFGPVTLTKENCDESGTTPVCLMSSGRTSNNILPPRVYKSRISPYFRRKPLNPISGRSSSCCQLLSHSTSPLLVNGSSSRNGILSTYHRPHPLNPLPLIFETHQQEQHRVEDGGLSQIRRPHVHHPSFPLDHLLVDGLKRKTEECDSTPLVVPALTRSKSLEDLRECIKPKLKSLSTDMTGGSVCSFEASALSPRNTRGRLGMGTEGYNSTFPPFNTPFHRKDFENEMKKEIDSMSMRIEKLDVVWN